ncbi:hypothetical protein IFM89_008920 [Coptis chinensis]|uniref:Large ribosomal subunit protein bL20c n=1 Tax=Coptis chinensis TaxID=261450 RepID=A0A835H478_9MAGN|nr:hypothetical protein IFM89_008920 [Coptis chinensis]
MNTSSEPSTTNEEDLESDLDEEVDTEDSEDMTDDLRFEAGLEHPDQEVINYEIQDMAGLEDDCERFDDQPIPLAMDDSTVIRQIQDKESAASEQGGKALVMEGSSNTQDYSKKGSEDNINTTAFDQTVVPYLNCWDAKEARKCLCCNVDLWLFFPFSHLCQVNYGNFMHGLMKENIQLNRKVLSELSMHEPYSFKSLVDISRNAFPGNKKVVVILRSLDISGTDLVPHEYSRAQLQCIPHGLVYQQCNNSRVTQWIIFKYCPSEPNYAKEANLRRCGFCVPSALVPKAEKAKTLPYSRRLA